MHIYFSHIIPTRKARVIYESCSTSLFTYTFTYIHARTQSCSRINFHCHTRRLHDLHLCLWTQRHRNPSVKYSRSVRLTYCIISSVLFFHFVIPRKWLPLFSRWGKKIDKFAKLFGRDFGVDSRGFRFSRRENGRGEGGAIPWSLSSWPRKVRGFSREQSFLTLLLCLPFFRLSRPPH